MLKNKIYFSLFVVIVGCQTSSYIIPESNLSVKENRKAIVAAVGDVKSVSENGREIVTPFHNRSFKVLDDTSTMKTRYYTKVVVLGARRPYEVSVEVRKEQKDPETKKFLDQGIDEGLTQIRMVAIQQMLNQSREKVAPAFDVENPF